MKYVQKKFTVGGHGKEYAEGWERTFGKKKRVCPEPPPPPEKQPPDPENPADD